MTPKEAKLKLELEQMTEWRDKAVEEYHKVLKELEEARARKIKPEPSRLEVAAMLLSAFYANDKSPGNSNRDVSEWAVTSAHALISHNNRIK